jgi:putative membrane protein
MSSVSGIPAFLLYFGLGGVLTICFALVYSRLTAHDELALIRQGNMAAAIALGGNLLGFSIPLDKAIAQAIGLLDCLVWAGVALAVQAAIYVCVRMLIPELSAKIEQNNTAAALFLGLVAIAGGMLNAAAMTVTPGT